MSDLRDKIFEIFFEDENVETLDDVPEVEEKVETKQESKTQIKAPNAHDILYGESDKKNSSFIDYFEPINLQSSKVEDKPLESDSLYQLKENISPIFGAVQEKAKKKKPIAEREIQKAITNNSNEYVNIVISPIFGYDVQKANDVKSYFEQIEEAQQEDILEEESAFDFPEISKNNLKVAKDAMYEAVPELDVGIRTERAVEQQEKRLQDEPKPKANRSIYDSQPINLFDFDAVEQEDNQTKDLFDELVGDDQ